MVKLVEQVGKHMDLNIYEAKVYTALLSRGISNAGDLADMSGVPRSRCYDVLESLEKKGFVFQKIGKPIKYIAVQPSDVLETLKKHARVEEQRKLSLIDEVQAAETFDELKALYTGGINHLTPEQVSSLITGRQAVNLFLKELFGSAQESIVIHTTETGALRKNKILRKSASVPVTIKSPAQELPHKAGTTKLVTKTPLLRTVHVDKDQVLVFTSHEEEEDAALWIKSPFAATTIKRFLE